MTDALPITLHTLTTEAAGGTSAFVDIGRQRTCLRLQLVADALSGNLAVTLQTSPQSSGPWEQVGSFSGLNAPATSQVVLLGSKRFVRAQWTLSGTGATANFGVTGEAHTVFSTPDDVSRYAFPERVFASLDEETKAACCLAASDEAAGYLNTDTLQSWGDALTIHVAKMAGYYMMVRRGFQPQGSDDLIVKGYDDAIKWLSMVAKGSISPGTSAGPPSTTANRGAARVASLSARGW